MTSPLEPPKRCELCEREVHNQTIHHLIPRSRGKKKQVLPTALLCAACHRQLHALYTNRELAHSYASLDALKADPSVQKFISWVRRQDANKRVRVRR